MVMTGHCSALYTVMYSECKHRACQAWLAGDRGLPELAGSSGRLWEKKGVGRRISLCDGHTPAPLIESY